MQTSEESEDDGNKCPKCESKENLIYDDNGFRIVECRACLVKRKSRQFNDNPIEILKKLGVPLRYTQCSFENFKCSKESEPTYNACKSIDHTFTSSLFIHSNRPGTGKTHLAVSIIRNLCEAGALKKPKFISSPFLFLEIKASFNSENQESESQVIEKYTNCEFLFVDDIGVEKCSDWANQIWYMIIDSRYSQLKPTVYTSNLSIGDIASKIDPRIASRLASGIVLSLETGDYRLKK